VSEQPTARRPRYGWFVALAVFALIVYVSLNTLRSDHVSSRGPKAGSHVPPFAAPLALGDLDGDVNVARKAGEGEAGDRPACSVRGPQILNSCQLAERGPFVLAVLATRGTKCTGQLDVLERARAAHPDVQFAAVAIRGDRGDLRTLVRSHGWRFPVAYDHDGILANLLGVAACPLLAYALPGGVVRESTVGEVRASDLDRRLTALERAARAKGWHP
jgi:hypothetical protein